MERYYNFSREELIKSPKIKLNILKTNDDVFKNIAVEMAEGIQKNNSENKKTVYICPVGPIGQYSFFVDIVNTKNIDLKNTWFINMDEYLDNNKQWIDIHDKLSFRGFMEKNVYSKIKSELIMPQNQRVFPDPNNISYIPQLIKNLGGVDIAFGGIGINGHIAFNEPQPDLSPEEFLKLQTRVLQISKETQTVNSISDLNGAIEAMPNYCITIGINEIYSAKKIRLACFRDWHRAVVRKACYGDISAGFPVTLFQNHNDVKITITEFVANL